MDVAFIYLLVFQLLAAIFPEHRHMFEQYLLKCNAYPSKNNEGEFMNELVENVISELRYIKNDWDESVEDDELRRGSTVLRRLLIDKELAQALRAAGFNSNPKLEASTLDPI